MWTRRNPPGEWGQKSLGTPISPPSCPQHDGQPYCHKPCYGILFGPKGEYGQEGGEPGAPSPSLCPPILSAAFLCRSEYWSRGQLHLRQGP